MNFRVKRIKEHFEVYDNSGRFLFSADDMNEVEELISEE